MSNIFPRLKHQTTIVFAPLQNFTSLQVFDAFQINAKHISKIEALKSLTIHQQLRSFLLLCEILRHYKYLTPPKAMPPTSNHGC